MPPAAAAVVEAIAVEVSPAEPTSKPVHHPSGGRPVEPPEVPKATSVLPKGGGLKFKLFPEGDECPWWERNEDVDGPFGKRSSSVYTNWCKGGSYATANQLKKSGALARAHPPGAWVEELETRKALADAETAAAKIVFGHEEL